MTTVTALPILPARNVDSTEDGSATSGMPVCAIPAVRVRRVIDPYPDRCQVAGATGANRDPFVKTFDDETDNRTGLDPGAIGELPTDLPVLTVAFFSTGRLCVLTMSGELNRSSIPALDASIEQIGGSRCERIVLDVSRLKRLDSAGTLALVSLDQYVRALGARLTFAGARGQVAQALAFTRLALGSVPNDVAIRTRREPDWAIAKLESPISDAIVSSRR
jgi:anti-anti-sigma factor